MKSSKNLFGVAILSILLNIGSISFVEASFFNFFTNSKNVKSDSKLKTKNKKIITSPFNIKPHLKLDSKKLKMTGSNDINMNLKHSASNTNMYFSTEPGEFEYCFHHDFDILGHEFSLDSHNISGIHGFSHSTGSSIDSHKLGINILHDDNSNCNTGNLTGIVYYDSNKNDQYDNGETGTKDIEVEVTDENGNKLTVKTDDSGKYRITNILEGSVTIFIKTETLPEGTELNYSTNNPSVVTIKAHEESEAKKYGYIDGNINS